MAKQKEQLLYLGPVSSITLDLGEKTERSISLVTGKTYDDLPDHPQIANLKANKLLVPAPPQETMGDSETDKTGDDRSKTAPIAKTKEGKDQ